MLATYPAKNDLIPDTPEHIASLENALCSHPASIARACADTKTGIVCEVFVKPVVADITRWCNQKAAWFRKLVADDDYAQKLNEARTREPEIDRSNRETVDELRARLGPTFGLSRVPKGSLSLPDDLKHEDEDSAAERRRQESAEALKQSCRAIEEQYRRLGAQPVYAAAGIPVSPSLLASLGREPKRSDSDVDLWASEAAE